MSVVGEKCVWLQNKERIDTHNIHITDINNSEYNTGVKRAAKQVWNTPAFLDQKSWNL